METNEQNLDFFEAHDERVSMRLAGVCPWLALAFPMCYLGTFAGIFNMDYGNLTILSRQSRGYSR